MSNTTNTERLARLNVFRVAEGKAPFAEWRNARHTPMLNEYLAAQAAAFVEDEERADPAGPGTNADAPVIALDLGAVHENALDVVNANPADLVLPGSDESVEVAPKAKAPSYKDFANYDKSSVVKPVEFVHGFLDANPGLSRKAAVQALVEAGVNYSTARTQYQRWFTARKG